MAHAHLHGPPQRRGLLRRAAHQRQPRQGNTKRAGGEWLRGPWVWAASAARDATALLGDGWCGSRARALLDFQARPPLADD